MIEAPLGSPPFVVELVRRVNAELLNRSQLPVKMPSCTVATLPDPVRFKDCWIKVSDETGGDTAAESDGTNWRRMQDRAIVS